MIVVLRTKKRARPPTSAALALLVLGGHNCLDPPDKLATLVAYAAARGDFAHTNDGHAPGIVDFSFV